MQKYVIKNAKIVNEGEIKEGDVLINKDRIEKVGGQIDVSAREIDARGYYLMPGIIDDQVHFREPGLTHKACIETESKAAAAGGVTSYMEMPNTKPAATTQDLLQRKYDIAARDSWVNYSFYMGAANDNYEEVLKTDKKTVCGIKIFMGSSTGNMLVDDEAILRKYFRDVDLLMATHCEDESRVRQRMEDFRKKHGEDPPANIHPVIRDSEACYLSSSKAVELAKEYGSRLHVLHLTTAKELELFEPGDLASKHITAEVCVHHLTYCDEDYETYGNGIKCNPAIKTANDREALWKALLEDRIDVIATDHAPHTADEKAQNYWNAPSGLPLIQHTLPMMLQFYHKGRISLEKISEKMCHAPARMFHIADRGFIREGYKADLILVDTERPWLVQKENLLYRCGWSNLEGQQMKGRVMKTWVNGELVYNHGQFRGAGMGERLAFNR
ncbi:MAG TPA: dihydroorotase [Saprospiraceae bacterium]|nr:dihydroorotase [Saprospiraceae bacterium]